MNTSLKWTLTAALVTVTMIASAVPVAADTVDQTRQQYRETMWSLVPTMGQWATELRDAVAVAAVKPEQACPVTLPALAYRGQGMVEDLRGTVPPAELADVHLQLIGEMEELTAIAQGACEDPSGYAEGLRIERARLTRIRQSIMAWVLADSTPIEVPVGR